MKRRASYGAWPSRLALGAKNHPRSLARKGRENFSERYKAPFGKVEYIRISFLPHTQVPSAPQGTSRCRPRHEEASGHEKEHRLHHHGQQGVRLCGHRHQSAEYDIPKEESDQECFEGIAAAYFAESEVEGLTSIRYDIVSLLVTGSEKAFLRHHKNVLNGRR